MTNLIVMLKHGTLRAFQSMARPLQENELAYVSDTHQLAVGTKDGFDLFPADEIIKRAPTTNLGGDQVPVHLPDNLPWQEPAIREDDE